MAGLASSCSDDEASGPLTFESYELVLDSQQHDPYFTVEVCADDDQPAQVTISAVKGRVVRGAKPSSLSFAVAWSDGPRFASVFGGRQPLPDAYVPVVGAKGTISTCDDGHVSAALAVAFPHVSDQPMSARNVTVDYDIDGHHYVGEAAVLFAQCPIGEWPPRIGWVGGCAGRSTVESAVTERERRSSLATIRSRAAPHSTRRDTRLARAATTAEPSAIHIDVSTVPGRSGRGGIGTADQGRSARARASVETPSSRTSHTYPRRMDHEEQRLAHQTRLAQWALRTLGQAILFSALVGGVVGVFGVMAGAGVLVAIAPAAGLVTFGAVLAGSDAPKPPSYRSPDSSAA